MKRPHSLGGGLYIESPLSLPRGGHTKFCNGCHVALYRSMHRENGDCRFDPDRDNKLKFIKKMETSIKFKAQDEPEDDLVSFSLEDVRVKDLGVVLNHLPEALAKAYANTVAMQRSEAEDVCEQAEAFILSRCRKQ